MYGHPDLVGAWARAWEEGMSVRMYGRRSSSLLARCRHAARGAGLVLCGAVICVAAVTVLSAEFALGPAITAGTEARRG